MIRQCMFKWNRRFKSVQQEVEGEPSPSSKVDALIYCIKALGMATAITSLVSASLFYCARHKYNIKSLEDASQVANLKMNELREYLGVPAVPMKEMSDLDREDEQALYDYFNSPPSSSSENSESNDTV
ncbi:hypothetical protein MP228_008183 [Amoeboaphelidium protococcarum]|nr:hypothetical protein MP228_008183 [Amoeboaphelidium protococcarum]